MDWTVFVVQWLHVILAIMWFGGILYLDFVLIPAFMQLPQATQRAVTAAIGVRATKIIPSVAGAVILLGIVRGTVFGQIQSLTALTSMYGLTWLLGLLLSIGLYVFGMRSIEPNLRAVNALSDAEALNPDGTATPALVALLVTAKRNAMVELLLFVAIFTCMILMRFGL